MKLTEEHIFWLRQIDNHGDLMTAVPGGTKALAWVLASIPGRRDLVYRHGLGHLSLTDAGRSALSTDRGERDGE